jgi:CRISPR-associated endonuclease/helicase Cas3
MKTKIWGKSKVNEKEISLAQHINDVLEVFQYLGEKVKQQDLKELIKIVIAYHDAGKVLPYFQRKTLKNSDYQPFEVYTNIPHSLLSTLLVDQKALKKQLKTIFNGNWEKIEIYSNYVLSAIAYHHWRDNFYDIVEGHTDVFERLAKLVANTEKWNHIEENLKSVYSDISNGEVKMTLNRKWLEGLINGIRYADYVIPPYLLYRMPKRIEMDSSHLKDWVLLSGFTMLSDHFASYIEGKAEADISADKIEIEGLDFETIKKAIDSDLQKKVKEYDPSKIWQFQCVDECKNNNTILLAPTGMGKTEFSYLWSNGVKFFYALPLRAAVNQIFDRTKNVFGENKAGLLHSDADVYIFGEGGESESMRIYELARNLSYPAIVSTGDQFFPYALRPPSYEKIFAKFSYSRLIIDEVQAYDPKAAAIVVKFIEHIVQMGGKFLLMTATLPKFIKDEIERRIYNKNEEIKNYKELNLFEKDTALANFSKHRIQIKVEDYKEDKLSYSVELIQKMIRKANENGGSRILVVVNTVTQAQAVFDDLQKEAKGSVDIRLFHSRFTQAHRKTKEGNLSKFIGNNDISRADKRAKILVATQVVEASLDLDADFLFTELAPWDSLIQRMGRVLREAHPKTKNLDKVVSERYHNKNEVNHPAELTLFNQIESDCELPENIFVVVYKGKNRKGKEVFESGRGYVYNEDLLRVTLKLIDDRQTDFAKWIKKPTFDFKKLEKATLNLTEGDKNAFVKLLFEGIPTDSKYLKNFFGMLQILDAGFMSDRKSDAQKVFREINDVNVISSKLRGKFIEELKSFRFEEKYAYTRFKRDIHSKYVISVQISKVKQYLTEINQVHYSIRINEEITEPKILSKLKNWMWGVYFVDLEYSDISGLKGINELTEFEIF